MIFIFTNPNGWLTFYRFYRSSNDHFDCIDLATPTATRETPKVGWFLLQKKTVRFRIVLPSFWVSIFSSEHIDGNLKRWRIHVVAWWCTNLIYIHFQGVNLVSSQASPTSVPHSKMLLVAVPNERNPHSKRWKLDQQEKHMEKQWPQCVVQRFPIPQFLPLQEFQTYIIYIYYFCNSFVLNITECLFN